MRRMIEHVRSHPFVAERPVLRQFFKFGMVGVVNTLTSATVYILLTRLVSVTPLVANALAFVIAVSVSFLLNKNWTFRDQQRAYAKQYSRFFLISLVGLGLSEMIIFVMHTRFGIHDLASFFTAVLLVMFWNFFANRWWTFRPASIPNPS